MFVLMGANGNITSKAATILLSRDHRVRVIGRDPARLQSLASAGADLAIGDAADPTVLASAFRGADAVYTMIPPNYAAPDLRAHQERLGVAIVAGLAAAGVPRVVNLSSVGAPLPSGTGPIAGLHDQEERLDRLAGLDLLHLRPAYFLENHLGSIPAIKGLGVFPGMLRADVPFPQIATRDIAAVLADELAHPRGPGRRIRHLLGARDVAMSDIARTLGRAAGKPDLAYVQAPPSQVKPALVQAGFSPGIADAFEEMSAALSDGRIAKTYARDAESTTPTTVEAFAPIFAAAFRGS